MFKKGLIAGFVLLVVGFGINWLFEQTFPQLSAEYQSSGLFRPWTDPLMMAYFGYPFILGWVLAYLWEKVKAKNAFEFAKLYFVIATIPGMFITYTSFQLSFLMVASWTVAGFVQSYLAGWVFAKIRS